MGWRITNIDTAALARKIDGVNRKLMPILCAQMLSDTSPYVKRESGQLEASGAISSNLNTGEISWNTVYAARQYYAIPTAFKTVNALAQWHWFEGAKTAHLQEWCKLVGDSFNG